MTERCLPDPPVPADVDLRGLEYMPLFGNHLFGSQFNSTLDDGAWRAGVTLWWAAWNQKPAGSLPDDDVALAQLAGLGRDVKTWKRVRAHALHGFALCTDGRLYHRFLCDQVLVAWEKRVKERRRKANWRATKAGTDHGPGPGRPEAVPRDTTGTERGRPADVPADGTGRDGTGRINQETARSDATSSAPADVGLRAETPGDTSPEPQPPDLIERRAEVAIVLRDCGIATQPGHPLVVQWAEAGVADDVLRNAAAIAKGRKGPGARIGADYLEGIVADILAKRGGPPERRPTVAWWVSDTATREKGRELGLEPRSGESWDQFRDRIRTAIDKRGDEAAA